MKKAVRRIALLLLVCMLAGMLPLQAAATQKDTSKIFEDISPNAWYKEAVDYVYGLGLFSGTSKTAFEPEANVDRAMFVTVLARLDGAKVNNKATTKFTDVPKGQWYTGSVKWASDNGIVNGATATTFAPETAISREQMCAMIVRYANYKDITLKKSVAGATFADDGDISSYAKSAVYACQRAGIVNGVTTTRFDPAATATRAQAAKILMIFHKDYIAAKTEPVPPTDEPIDPPVDDPVDPPVDDPTDDPVTPPVEEDNALKELLENKTKLRFNEDGEFKVMVLADLHTKAGGLTPEQQGYVKTMVDREQPDFVIFTGDNVRSLASTPISDEAAMRVVLDSMVGYLEEQGIYWMHVYGNHDDEDNPLDKETQQAIYEEYEYCLSKDVEELTGVGNYVVPLYGSDESEDEIKFAFWGLDSGSYMSAEDKAALFPAGVSGYTGYSGTGYDYIHHDQIRWYENTSEQLEEYVGAKVPGLMAFHIPLQEYSTAWDNRETLDHSGYKMENVCASAYNSGLFDAMRSRGDIKATVSGHDHKNSFMVEYGGIKLCYSPTMSTNSYYDEKEMGSRVFVLSEDDPADVETYMSYLIERIDTSDAKPIESGYTYDFEGTAPTFAVSGNNGWAGADVDKIAVSVKDGVGKDGSKALAATRTEWNTEVSKRTMEIKWDIPYGKLGENKYVAVWMDLATDDLEFRKTNFGLITDYDYTAPYRTDESDGVNTPFYYKADGTAEWVTLQTGTDGCIGAGDNCPVKDYKGWFAFPIEYMLQYQTDAQLNKDSVITGFYIFTQLYEESMTGKDIIFDNFTLVRDYKSLGLQVLPSGTTFDFEGEAPALKIGYANYSATENKHDTIYAQILENKGIGGSKALAVCRTEWGTNNTERNAAAQWNAPSEGLLGDNEYLMVWMDLGTNNAEFRKASWGLLCSDSTNPYRTDDYGAGAQFYYKADGSDRWITHSLGSDGCFGAGDLCPVKGLKGWFAFPTSTLKQGTNTLKKDSIVTGFYFYFCPNAESDVNQQVYIDNVMLVKDYKTAM